MKTISRLIIGSILLISTSITFGQSILYFKTSDSVVAIKPRTTVFKANLQIIKSDTLNAYNLYGFYDLISPLDFFNLSDSVCGLCCRLGCYIQDSKGNLLHTIKVLDDRNNILNKKKMKLKKVNYDYIVKHHLEKEQLGLYPIFTYVEKIKEKDTLLNKDIYINTENVKLLPGEYYLTFCFLKFPDSYKEQTIQDMKSKDPDFYENNPMENQYDKCIKSNKLKIIVK